MIDGGLSGNGSAPAPPSTSIQKKCEIHERVVYSHFIPKTKDDTP